MLLRPYADGVLATVTTNAHPYGAQLTALFLSIAPVFLVFLFIAVAAVGWYYRRKRRRPK
jgi:ABC-type multidrug transport system permease subunit